MALSDEKYMLLTTFKRDGTPVSSPVWVVGLDGVGVGFYTSSNSGKAKRLANTARVTVQACDARGKLKAGSQAVEATARLVTGAELEAVKAKVVAKYGVQTKVAKVANDIIGLVRRRKMPYADCAVVVTPG